MHSITRGEATHVGKRSFVLPPLDCRLGAARLLHPRALRNTRAKMEMKVEVEVAALGYILSNWNTTSVNPR